MNRCRGPGLVVVLVMAVYTSGSAQEVKGPGKEVMDLVREAEAGKDVSKKAAALHQRFTIRTAMRLYNPRSQGGFGFGPKGESIESALADLGEDGVTPESLKKNADQLKRVARINLVLAEVVRGLAPSKPFQGRGPKEWQRDADSLKSASADLLKAIEAGSTKDVQAAAVRVNKACSNCHDGKK